MGSWERIGLLYRIATIAGAASIVVTAVYILRATGRSIMGPVANQEFNGFSDASWNEKLAAIVLVAGILIMGLAPFLLKDLINPGTEEIMQKIVSSIK